jgi:hypothetical protein
MPSRAKGKGLETAHIAPRQYFLFPGVRGVGEGDIRCMTGIAGKLWGFCHTLRHDRSHYGDYIEQLTCLLFLKVIDEKGLEIPAFRLKRSTPQV